MSRYIDADHLIQRATNPYGDSWASTGESTSDFVDYINEEPTADVKPIVYGKWIYLYDFDGLEICECNKCGVSQEFDGGIFDVNSRRTNFCPNCGADMREERGVEE